MKKTISTLMLAIVSVVYAKEDDPAATPPPPPAAEAVVVRIYVTPVRGIMTETSQLTALPTHLHCPHALESGSIRLHRNQYTSPLRLKPGSPLLLKETSGEVYIREEIPADWDQVLAVLHPDEPGKNGRPRVDLYPADPEQVPKGWHTFRNALGAMVEIRFGESTHVLKDGESISLKPNADRERVFIREIGVERGRLYTGAVYRVEGRGSLHILSPRPDSGRRMRMLSLTGPLQAAPDVSSP